MGNILKAYPCDYPPNPPKWGDLGQTGTLQVQLIYEMKVNTKIQTSFFYGASPKIFERARELRSNMTDTEVLLWKRLNKGQIFGLQFRKQHPINQFISDFYCHKVLLVIEVDGIVHSNTQQSERDQGRDYFMNELGLTILRFTNKTHFV